MKVNTYTTIASTFSAKLVIKKSTFLSFAIPVDKEQDVEVLLRNFKKKYYDARHICYAYILDNNIKFDDDNEPSGTAGLPILEVLKKNNLNHVICIVIRYFGGIKLGSGGLIRAYSNSCSLCLKKTNLILLELKYKIKIILDYNDQKKLSFLNKDNIINIIYSNNIIYYLLINKDILTKLNDLNIKYELLEENYF